MVRSMTGYGRSTLEYGKATILVEIRSVNQRFLDIVPKYPRTFLFLEEKIKKVVKSYFNRGRVELHITIDGNAFVEKKIVTDWNLMDQLMNELKLIKDRYAIQSEIPLSLFTQLPDMITIQEVEQKTDDLQEKLLSCVEDACMQVLKMRVEEGNNLIVDILHRVDGIRDIAKKLEARRENVITEYRSRIRQRIEEYTDHSMELDNTRITQEIAILAEKGDITEEITRLHSHLNQIEMLTKQEEPVGRKLDFILQEMNREANTIGSKSTDVMISEWTVTMKSEIEKIKEQVQNIE